MTETSQAPYRCGTLRSSEEIPMEVGAIYAQTYGNQWCSVEYLWDPGEYLLFGNLPIENPPLIKTSLFELSELGWQLVVFGRYVVAKGHTKLSYRFRDAGAPNKFLQFKLWVPGRVLHKESQVRLFVSLRPKPNFNKSPIGSYTIKEMPSIASLGLDCELELLQHWNKQRAEELKKKKRHETLVTSQERLAS